MAPRITFVDYDPGLQTIPLALDQAFADTGKLGIIECVATGTNTIALTPLAAAFPPEITAYATGLKFGFVTAGASTGSVTVNVSGVGAKNLYRQDGSTQVGANELVSGGYYVIVYQAALNGGAGGFMLTSGAGGVLNLTGLVITPPANTTDQGLVITQSSPTSGSAAGPLSFNLISVNNQYGTTGSADAYGLATHHVAALRVELTEGLNVTGFQSAIYARLNHTIGASTIVSADHVTGIFVAVSDQDANGKGLYALNGLAWAKSGADHGHVTASELEAGVFTGSTVNHKTGVRLHSWGTEHGALSDTAIAVVSQTGSSFNTLMLLGQFGEAQCIAATGQLFKADQALTVDSIFDFSNVTVTTNILDFPHVTLTGAGVLTLNKSAGAAPSPVAATVLHLAADTTAGITIDSFGPGGESAISLRRTLGSITVPTALQQNDLIGGIAWSGYGASQYPASSTAAIFAYANQNFTDAANGTYIDIFTTPDGSVTKAVAARIHNNKGISVGHTGSAGASSVNAAGNLIANGFVATGGTGVGTGEVRIGGNTSGAAVLTVQATAGTPTVTFGTSSGTPAVTASAPLSIAAATGNLTITTGTLSRVDDTNVTLTLGGTPTNALLNAVSLTLGWTGSLAATRGGTGTATVTTGDLLYGSGSNVWSKLAAVAVGAVLASNGTSTAPVWDTTPHISGSVAIGANTAVNSGVLLQLNANTVALPAGTFTGTVFQIGGADASAVRLYGDAFTSTVSQGFTFVFRKARGTAASRTAIQANDQLGSFFWDGFDGTGYNATDAAAIIGIAGENFTTSAHGTGFQFRTVPNGGLNSALSAIVHPSGGIVLSTATGGDKGLGTLNAVGVYDDNTLLTCYPFDLVRKGRIVVEEWDARVPNRKRFKRVPGPDGEMIDAPDGEEVREHDPLRKFMARLGTEHDPIRLDSYIKHWEDKGHLTSMPNEAKFDPEQGMPIGAWMQRTIESLELQAIHDRELRDNIRALAERVSALEARP